MQGNETDCTEIYDGEYRNETLKLLFRQRPDLKNASVCDVEAAVQQQCDNIMGEVTFDGVQLARVIITWTLFFISAIGNSFVIFCVYKKARTSHVHLIMLHFAIADLAFTFLVSPKDAMWNTTMQWYGGTFLCKVCQMGTQIGMYVSSGMVVVMALDRYCGILLPMSSAKQRKRTKYLVGGAWILSIISAVPAAFIFDVMEAPICPDKLLKQCVDFNVLTREQLRPYLFFTMAMSFLVPMILCVILYTLVACEINNMIRRDMDMLGRRDSSPSIRGARKKTLLMTLLVTLTFLLFWGPYYGFGVYYWFNADHRLPKQVAMMLFILMYFHPALHPFIYGVLMRDVRETFRTLMLHVKKILTCNTSEFERPCSCLVVHNRRHGTQSTRRLVTTHIEGGSGKRVSGANGHHVAAGQQPLNKDRPSMEDSGLLSGNSSQSDTADGQYKASRNGFARTSQVAFKLPHESPPADKSLGLNNNKEKGENNRNEDVNSSSAV